MRKKEYSLYVVDEGEKKRMRISNRKRQWKKILGVKDDEKNTKVGKKDGGHVEEIHRGGAKIEKKKSKLLSLLAGSALSLRFCTKGEERGTYIGRQVWRSYRQTVISPAAWKP